MGRTRLYQAPGSPLIQGQSRMERPLWRAWAASTLLGLVIPVVVLWLLPTDDNQSASLAAMGAAFPVWFDSFPIAHLATAGGAIGGVLFARTWGSKRWWVFGSLLATAAWYLAVVVVG